MNFEQFKDVMSWKHPTVSVLEGPARKWDDHQNDYVTIALGGLRKEGDSFPMYAVSATEALRGWWTFFGLHLKDAVEVHVRRPPEVYEEVIQVLDTCLHDKPTLVEVPRYQVIGRFTFYTKEDLDNHTEGTP